jgi:serine/threonine-protein kinase RsbW
MLTCSKTSPRQERVEPRNRQEWCRVTVRTAPETIWVVDGVVTAMAFAGYPDTDRFAVRLALEEAIVNGIKHGHRNDPRKVVRVRYHVSAARLLAEVEDQGPGFDPRQVPNPCDPDRLDKPSGRGLLLMRSYLTWLRFNERGNCVTLCKVRSS